VDKADPLSNGSKRGEAEKAARGLVIACRYSAAVLQPVDESLDPVSQDVDGVVDGMLHPAVGLGRYFGGTTMGTDVVADRAAVVASVSQQHLWIGVVVGHHVGEDGAVVSLTGGQQESDRKTLSVGPKGDFGRERAARAAKSLALNPPWRRRHSSVPAQSLSTIYKASLPPPAASADSIKSHSSLAVQRRNCRLTEFQLPDSSGKSRHGTPVRAAQKIASSTRRWSCGDRPRGGPVSVTNGSKNPRSSSLRRTRITADLAHENQLRIIPVRAEGIPLLRFVHAA